MKRLLVASSAFTFLPFRFSAAKCDASESPCDKYNTMLQRLQWAQRRERCNDNSSCVFVGRSVLGTCALKDKEAANVVNGPSVDSGRDETSPLALVAELIPVGDGPPLQVLLTGSLAKTAADSLKSSRETTAQLAKTLVIDVLHDPENIGKAGELLKSLCEYESIRSPTRWLIYYSLSHPYNTEEIVKIAKLQRDHWLVGNEYTIDQVAQLVEWQLRDKETRDTVFFPLTKWALVGPDSTTLQSLVGVLNESIPTWRESTTESLVETLHGVLDSQEIKDMAKGVILDILKEKLEQQEQEQQRFKEEEERRVQEMLRANNPDLEAPETAETATPSQEQLDAQVPDALPTAEP